MSSEAQSLLLTETTDGVTTLTLNNPATRNSLSMEMLRVLSGKLDELADDPSTRVVVLAATGKVFCAGHDLKEVQGQLGSTPFMLSLFELCSKVMQQIVNLPKPVVARVEGVATAAGCQLVASCDLAVAGESARFATPGVNIGLFCSTPMVALSRNVSPKHAMEMLLTGEMISAARAEQIGLVNKVVADSELNKTVADMAATIASKSSHTLKIGKQAFYRQLEMPLHEAYAYTSQVMATNLESADSEEGICAFLAKRPAQWEDR